MREDLAGQAIEIIFLPDVFDRRTIHALGVQTDQPASRFIQKIERPQLRLGSGHEMRQGFVGQSVDVDRRQIGQEFAKPGLPLERAGELLVLIIQGLFGLDQLRLGTLALLERGLDLFGHAVDRFADQSQRVMVSAGGASRKIPRPDRLRYLGQPL